MIPFRRMLDVLDGQRIEMLSLEPRANMAIKASDSPVVITREQAADLINALGEAFEFPVHIVCGVVHTTRQVPGIVTQQDLDALRETTVRRAMARLRGEPAEASTFAL